MTDHSSGRSLDIACDVPHLRSASLNDEAQVSRRPRRGALQPKPVREFTVHTSPDGPTTTVKADTISTLGDWFTLSLRGHEVFGAPRDRVLQYTATPVEEAA